MVVSNLQRGKSPWAGIGAGACFVLIMVFALAFRQASGSSAFLGIALAGGIGLLESLLAAAHYHFSNRVDYEREQASLELPGYSSEELFDESRDDAVKDAERVATQYDKYAVPAVAAAVGIASVLLAIAGWRSLAAQTLADEIKFVFQYGVICLAVFVGCLIAGSFFNGLSREQSGRWLRPAGGWLLLTALLFLGAGIYMLGVQMRPEWIDYDKTVGRVIIVVVGLLAAETVATIIIEYYRPKIAGQEVLPPFESRILGLFTQPGGVARNLALSLDYQFGFRISEASFYRFLQRSLLPFVLLVAGGLWLLTCVVVIEVDEHGIRERFGKVTAGRNRALPPGLYFKLPAPFARINTFPTGKVQQLDIGYVRGDEGEFDGAPEMMGDPTGRVIVWSKTHNAEETDFVVATKRFEQAIEDKTVQVLDDRDENRAVPVSFISASIPVYYRVANLYAYLYEHANARRALEDIATREIVAYLASIDFFDVLTGDRGASAELLQKRIQTAANATGLGIEIAFVGLEGLHPPVRVGADFDAVVGASEEMHTEILEAQRYAIKREPDAQIEAFRTTADAEAYKLQRVRVAQAEAGRFMSQLIAFRAAPEIYPLRTFLDLLETDAADIRKFIVSVNDATEVTILNLEEKLRPDLLDVDLDAPGD